MNNKKHNQEIIENKLRWYFRDQEQLTSLPPDWWRDAVLRANSMEQHHSTNVISKLIFKKERVDSSRKPIVTPLFGARRVFKIAVNFALGILLVAGISTSVVAAVNHFKIGVHTEPPTRTLYVQSTSDGQGNMFIAWQNDNGIFIQKLDSTGQATWNTDGVQVSQVPNYFDAYGPRKTQFVLTADGTGGVIVTWVASETSDEPVPVYSQHVSSEGRIMWASDIQTGKIEPVVGDFPCVVADGQGGIIFAWDDYKTVYGGLRDDYLRVQYITAAGETLWGENGILVTASSPYGRLTPEEIAAGAKGTYTRSMPTYEGEQQITSDGENGVIITWGVQTGVFEGQILALRLNDKGEQIWKEPAVIWAGATFFPTSIAGDGSGGAFVSGTDNSGLLVQIQHVNGEGETTWPEPLNYDSQGYATGIISDGNGGILFYHSESVPRTGPPNERQVEFFVNKLSPVGDLLWSETPVFTLEPGQIFEPSVAPSMSGGAVIAWRQHDSGSVIGGKIYAYLLDKEGKPLLSKDTMVFADISLEYQGYPETLAISPSRILVIAPAGQDNRAGDMVYAQLVDGFGGTLWENGKRIDG